VKVSTTNEVKVELGSMKELNFKDEWLAFKTKLNGVKSSVNIFTWMKEGLPWGWHVTQFKIKTPMKMCFSFMIILFYDPLGLANSIYIYYMWQSSSLQTKVPSCLTWAIVGLDTEIFKHYVH